MTDQKGTQLLLNCLMTTSPDKIPTSLENLSPQDWEHLWDASSLHGLGPLLNYRLYELGLLTDAPHNISHKLRNIMRINARRNILTFNQLGNALQALNNTGIPVIVLKGAHLAELVYPDTALRPFGDIDLLVRKEDLPGALKSFYALGYSPHWDFDIQNECQRAYHMPPLSGPGPLSIDLHWNISNPAYPFPINPRDLWDRAQKATIAGQPVHVLSPEDLLFHLTLHTSVQHRFALGLMPICDISSLIYRHRNTLNWILVKTLAHQWNLKKCLFLALSLSKELFQPPIPDEILTSLQPEDYDPITLQIIKEHVLAGRSQLTLNLAELLEGESLSKKAIRFYRRIFIPPDVMVREYGLPPGSPRIYLQYLSRVRTLLLKNSGDAIEFVRRNPVALASARRQNQITALRDWMCTP